MKYIISLLFVVSFSLVALERDASADCQCVSVAADVKADVRARVMTADNLFATGDYAGALAIYAEAYAKSKDPALLYAQAQSHWQLGDSAKAKAQFDAYLATGANAKYSARAKGALSALARGLSAEAAAVGDLAAGATGDIGGEVEGSVEAGADGVAAGVGAGVGAGADLGGTVGKKAKPPKVAKGAAIVLFVVAAAAVSAVAVQSISAGLKDDVDFDTKFNLSLGATGAVVGGTAIYLWGLTAAAGATAGGADCPPLASRTPRTIIAPVAHPGGGGLAAAFRF